MGCQRLIVLSAFLLLTKDYEVSAQYATVLECLPPPSATITRPVVQSGGQYILPAIIQPIMPGYDQCPDPSPSYPYSNSPAPYQGYPPIIIKDSDDTLRSLLYFLIFSMGKKDNSPPPYVCSPSSGNSQSSCNCPNCSKSSDSDSTSAPIYIPVPIAIPVYTGPDGCRYIDGFCDDIIVQDGCAQCNCNACYGKEANEINLIIRTSE